MDCSPLGSSVHGISQIRILEWLPFPSPAYLPDPGIEPMSLALAGRFFTAEPPGKVIINITYIIKLIFNFQNSLEVGIEDKGLYDLS